MANVTREIARINAAEQQRGANLDASWHNDYKDTSWIFAGNLSYKLSEGDVLAVFSEYGEIEDIHLVRDPDTGESKGFCFLKYEDWRSTVLAVDNLNNALLLGRNIRVDHSRYERPKLKKDEEEQLSLEEKVALQQPGHAYQRTDKILVEGKYDLSRGHNVFERKSERRPTDGGFSSDSSESDEARDKRKRRKKKRKYEREQRDGEGSKERSNKKRKRKIKKHRSRSGEREEEGGKKRKKKRKNRE